MTLQASMNTLLFAAKFGTLAEEVGKIEDADLRPLLIDAVTQLNDCQAFTD